MAVEPLKEVIDLVHLGLYLTHGSVPTVAMPPQFYL